jgi:ATP adenylyltransferase/5',5'''-P-1,P-4-tetraphosphate phosphorylase II
MKQLIELIRTKNQSARQVLNEFTELQKLDWPLAATNFESLKFVEERSFIFDGFEIRAQYNPGRMRSSVAEVDKQSIAARKCFLCNENRPTEQHAIAFGDQLIILVNPYPIFKNHFTISSNSHIDQRFMPHVRALLEVAQAMEGFTVFYNGPECGASAPDHLHFQAGESSFLPVTSEFGSLKIHSGRILFNSSTKKVWAFEQYLRKMISIETGSIDEALRIIRIYYKHFSAMQTDKVEPMMNALCNFYDNRLMVHLFPRKAHRPSYFFEKGEKQILISPGSVDFGGVFILPRREDFDKLTNPIIEDIFNQVCLDQKPFNELITKIETELNL